MSLERDSSENHFKEDDSSAPNVTLEAVLVLY